MANLQSAKKRIRSSARRREHNRRYKTAARTYVKQARLFIEEGDLEQAGIAVDLASSTLDKAARRGVVHPRNAARRKGRLMAALDAARKAAA